MRWTPYIPIHIDWISFAKIGCLRQPAQNRDIVLKIILPCKCFKGLIFGNTYFNGLICTHRYIYINIRYTHVYYKYVATCWGYINFAKFQLASWIFLSKTQVTCIWAISSDRSDTYIFYDLYTQLPRSINSTYQHYGWKTYGDAFVYK